MVLAKERGRWRYLYTCYTPTPYLVSSHRQHLHREFSPKTNSFLHFWISRYYSILYKLSLHLLHAHIHRVSSHRQHLHLEFSPKNIFFFPHFWIFSYYPISYQLSLHLLHAHVDRVSSHRQHLHLRRGSLYLFIFFISKERKEDKLILINYPISYHCCMPTPYVSEVNVDIFI